MVKLVPMLNHSGLYCQEMMEVAVAPLEFCAVIDLTKIQFFLHDGCPSCDTINSISWQSTNAASSWRPQLSMNALGHKATGLATSPGLASSRETRRLSMEPSFLWCFFLVPLLFGPVDSLSQLSLLPSKSVALAKTSLEALCCIYQ